MYMRTRSTFGALVAKFGKVFEVLAGLALIALMVYVGMNSEYIIETLGEYFGWTELPD